jgi:hypothetical protein
MIGKNGRPFRTLGSDGAKIRAMVLQKMQLPHTQRQKTRIQMSNNCTLHHVKGHHLRFDQRETIALIYYANLRLLPGKRKFLNQLAKELGLAKSTFSREINRGR